MTSQELATDLYTSISSFLGTYTRKDGGTLKAFWYYGRKPNNSASLSPHPPSDWKVRGLEVVIEAVPDLDVQNFQGGVSIDEFHNVRIIPHGDDVTNVQALITAIAEAAGTPVASNVIPANERLKIDTQYLLTIRK